MAEIDTTIEILSPMHLGSGQADVNLDAEIVHDALGFPYFPGKRFKGLLYESAIEILEMFELSGLSTEKLASREYILKDIFHRYSENAIQIKNSIQIIVPNFFIRPFEKYEQLCREWNFLEKNYPETFTAKKVLNSFTSLRYQTRLENGITSEGSLRNLRVLESGLKFFGRITVLNADEKVLNLLALAMKNLSSAGTKRNRGFGRIKCTADFEGKSADELVQKIFAKVA